MALWGVQLRLPTGQCFNQGGELTFWQFNKIIQTLGRPLSSSFKSSKPTPQPISHPCLLFLSLPHVPLALLVPQAYAYIILILATFPVPRYLYQYPLQSRGAKRFSSPKTWHWASFYPLPIYLPFPCIFLNKRSYFFPTSHFPTLFGGGVPSCLNT